jgi:hypothetical protein
MARKVAHPSASDAQQDAETALLRELERRFGFRVAGERVELGNGCYANVDGINREHRFICEIYCRIGKLQTAQVEKVASDVLKLGVIERALGGVWRKAICFADDTAANTLRNRSWLATAAQQSGVEVIVAQLPEDVRANVLVAQARQVMVNKPSVDG